jgi:GNAT superfamily N-acetyltransferase
VKKITIVPCRTKEHKSEVVDMFHDLHEIHADRQPELFKHNTRQGIEKQLKENGWKYKHFVALSDEMFGTVVGFISLRIWRIPGGILSPPLKLVNVVEIYVKPFARRKKVATKLLAFAEEYAKKHKINNLMSTVAGFNGKSLDLFHRKGYSVTQFKMLKTIG